jgi:putative metallohydrolase (TIGR04338 family)
MSLFNMRDARRARAYQAEDRALLTMRARGIARAGQLDPPALASRFRAVLATGYIRQRYARLHSHPAVGPLVLQFIPGATRALGGARRLAFPTTGGLLNEMVLHHELAHAIVARQCVPLQGKVAPHGWQWAQVYLALVGRFMGAEARGILRAEFKAAGVRYNPPRKLSPEQRAALAERLRMVRAAKQEQTK